MIAQIKKRGIEMINVVLNKLDCNIINWDKIQLVGNRHNDKLLVVLTEGVHCGKDFSGTVVSSENEDRKIGWHCTSWVKQSFSLYNEPITLTNDEKSVEG